MRSRLLFPNHRCSKASKSPAGRRDRGIDVLPIGARLLDAEGQADETRVDLPRFRGALRLAGHPVLAAHGLDPHSDLQLEER